MINAYFSHLSKKHANVSDNLTQALVETVDCTCHIHYFEGAAVFQRKSDKFVNLLHLAGKVEGGMETGKFLSELERGDLYPRVRRAGTANPLGRMVERVANPFQVWAHPLIAVLYASHLSSVLKYWAVMTLEGVDPVLLAGVESGKEDLQGLPAFEMLTAEELAKRLGHSVTPTGKVSNRLSGWLQYAFSAGGNKGGELREKVVPYKGFEAHERTYPATDKTMQIVEDFFIDEDG